MRVEEYDKDLIITDNDEFFGSDGDNNKKTVNFPATAIAEYVKEKIEDSIEGLDQNNKIRVIKIPVAELEEDTSEALTRYINNLPEPILVAEDEIVLFEVETIEESIQSFSAILGIDATDITTLYFWGIGEFPEEGDILYYDDSRSKLAPNILGYFLNQNTPVVFNTDASGSMQIVTQSK